MSSTKNAAVPESSKPELVRVRLKKKAHVAGCLAAPGAVVQVTQASADRLVADGMGVILY